MIRKIIHIDVERCNGCGACAAACHEGAIGMVNGKARLLRDDYCDGLGDCLPACPTGAITFVEREAAAYDHAAVLSAKAKRLLTPQGPTAPQGHGCPGMRARALSPAEGGDAVSTPSQLAQWPVQIKLAPVTAPYFQSADLLVAADCTAFACGDFHSRFIRGRITLVGCPKLDSVDYSEKLAAILTQNDIRSVTLARMEVPCCGGLERAVRTAIDASGKDIPLRTAVISTRGEVL